MQIHIHLAPLQGSKSQTHPPDRLQATPTTVYAGFSIPPDLGTTLRFYDVATLEGNGLANVRGVQE